MKIKKKAMISLGLAIVAISVSILLWSRTEKGRIFIYGKGWIRNGVYVDRFDNGQIRFLETRRDGKADGVTMQWFRDGKKEAEWYYLNGNRHGPCTTWMKDGSGVTRVFSNGVLTAQYEIAPNKTQEGIGEELAKPSE
jgi:antitoxin component YwqK of YwqJK toxin-antitoxin module